MAILRGKEKKVEKLYRAHIDRVDDCLEMLISTLDLYLAGDPEHKELAFQVHKTEHEADCIRRDIEKAVHEGAFLAIFRGDFIWLAEAIDKLANLAESIADTLVTEKPQIPTDLRDDFQKLLITSVAAFKPFRDIGSIILGDSEEVLDKARDVEDREQLSDELEFELLKRIFSDEELELAHKLQLKDLVKKLAGIANLAEDASDRLEVMLAKRRM